MKKFFLFCLGLIFFQFISFAQDPITSFTVSRINATCNSNGSITLTFPPPPSGSYQAGTWNAVLSATGQTDRQITIHADGSPVTFTNLSPASYSVSVTNGTSTLNHAQNPVIITSSYVNMQLGISGVMPSCPVTTPNRTDDATATVTVTGGLGPFEYRLISPSKGTLTTVSSNRTHTFTGLRGGEAIQYQVTDQGCGAIIPLANFTVPQNNDGGVVFTNDARFNCVRTSCNTNLLYINVDASSVLGNRLSTIQQAGNAVIRINNVDYPLTYLRGDLLHNSIARHRFVFDPTTVAGAPALTNGLAFQVRLNWGCDITTMSDTYRMDPNYLEPATDYIYNNCNWRNAISINPSPLYHLNWLPGATYTIEKEDPVGTFTEVANGTLPTPTGNSQQSTLLLSQNMTVFVNSGGRYRVTVRDDCRSVSKFVTFGAIPTNFPVDRISIGPTGSALEGTRAFFLDWGTTFEQTYPLTIRIERVDGNNNWTINPNAPLNLKGSYSFSFPVTRTYNVRNDQITFTDLPPGDYRLLISDGCTASNGYTRTVNLSLPNTSTPTYNPTYTSSSTCRNSTLNIALNPTNTLNPGEVRLSRLNDNGTVGATIQTLPYSNTGVTFSNFVTGNGKYRVFYVQTAWPAAYSVARNVTTPYQYFQDIELPIYQDIDVSISSQFCSPTDPNSGIANPFVVSGTLEYPLTMTLYRQSAPNTILSGPINITAPDKGTLFQNLSAGGYIVRTASACYTFDKSFTINVADNPPSARVSETAVCPNSPTTIAVINATTNLYDIEWFDMSTNNKVGDGMPITLTPASTRNYEARFRLRSTLNCTNPSTYTSSVPVTVTPNPDLSTPTVSNIELCKSSTDIPITITNSQQNFTYEFLTPGGQSYNPKITAAGTGGNINLTVPSANVSGLVAGNRHNIKVTNSNAGCAGNLTQDVTIIQSTHNLNLNVTGSFVCAGSPGTITIQNAENGVTYRVLRNGSVLSPNLTGTGNGGNLVLTVPASNLTAASTEFTIEASGSRCRTALLLQRATITVQQPPTVSAITHASCGTASGSVTLTTAGGSGNYEYSRDNSTWTTNPVFTGLAPGNYTFYSRDQNNNGCNTNGTIQVLNNCFEITKTPSSNTYNTAGQVINYSITIRNTGTTTLTNIAISDPQANLSTTVPSLAPTFSTQVSASYTITQADINAGSFTNTARGISANVDKQASATINAVQTRAISLTKTANTLIYTQTGQQITYTFTVRNTGNVPLSNVSISDPLPGLSAISPASVATLAPGAATTFTATYNITAQDMLNTTVQNTATASGTFNNVTVTHQSSVTLSNTFPLPATGLELSARWLNNNDAAELSWVTLTEQNTDYFVIERSTDGRNFTVIGNPVKAAGNSNSKRTYVDYDRNLKGISTVFYRLRLFDIDKSSRYSNTVILRSLNSGRFNVYPNPANNLFTIEFSQAGTYDVQLYNAEGQAVRKIKDVIIPAGNKVYTIDRGSLPNGTYTLRVFNKRTDEILTSKIVFIQ